MESLRIAQLGCGYWGPNLVRAFGKNLCAVADPSIERQRYLKENFPYLEVKRDFRELLGDQFIDALVIATPAGTHFSLAKEALLANKHVLVEKPLAMSVQEAAMLKGLAEERGRVLMVGHTFLYNNAVRKLKQLVKTEIGDPLYFYGQRVNLGKVRHDVNAWWNLAPHDLSILLYLMDQEPPEAISASGMASLQEEIEDVVFAVIRWASGQIAHLHVSWLDPCKVRKLTVIGRKKMVVYDDMAAEKLMIFDKGIDTSDPVNVPMVFDKEQAMQWTYRSGDILMPQIVMKEPLKAEAEHFIECIREGKEPLTGAQHALDVVALLEAGERSLKEGGRFVNLKELRVHAGVC